MSTVLMGFVGDVHVNRDTPREAFSDAREVLNAPHTPFANLKASTPMIRGRCGVRSVCSRPPLSE